MLVSNSLQACHKAVTKVRAPDMSAEPSLSSPGFSQLSLTQVMGPMGTRTPVTRASGARATSLPERNQVQLSSRWPD